MTCPRCRFTLLFVDVTDCGPDLERARHRLCQQCGFIEFLNDDGSVYQPPTLEAEQAEIRSQFTFAGRPRKPTGRKTRALYEGDHVVLRDGCRHHPVCKTCPFSDCIANYRQLPLRQQHLHQLRVFFGGTVPERVPVEHIKRLAGNMGVTVRTVYRLAAAARVTLTSPDTKPSW